MIPILEALIRALNLLLSIDSFFTAALFGWALLTGWDDATPRVRLLLWGCMLLFVVLGLLTGNLSWMFYVEGANARASLAHPTIRFTYLVGGPLALSIVGTAVLSRMPNWPRTLFVLLAINLTAIVFLVTISVKPWE